MVTTTAGDVSTEVASAAPVASARTLDTVAAASARTRQFGTFSLLAARRWAPRRRMISNILSSPSIAACGHESTTSLEPYIAVGVLHRKTGGLHFATRLCEHRFFRAPWHAPAKPGITCETLIRGPRGLDMAM